MAVIHETTMDPGKLELLAAWLPSRTWFAGSGTPALAKAGGFRLDDPDGEVGLEFMAVVDTSGERPVAYHVPLSYRGAPLDGAERGLVGTSEHGVLGRRWVYDGAHDPVLAAQTLALLQSRAEPQHQYESGVPATSVTSRFTGGAGSALAGVTAVADGADATDIAVEADPAGPLTIRLARVLGADVGASGAVGRVDADWTSPDGTRNRAPFAVLLGPPR